MRGRILARDGTVLAYDQPQVDLAMNYRWVEEPANPRWLRHMARARLMSAERRDARRVAEEEQAVLAERLELGGQLASLCNVTDAQWRARTEQIQRRIETLGNTVNARHQSEIVRQRRAADAEESTISSPLGWLTTIVRSLREALLDWDDASSSTSLSVAEELADHVVVEDVPLEVVAEIETHPQQYPGVTLIHSYRRAYPEGELAAHAVGYLGLANPQEVAAHTPSSSKENFDAYQPDDLVGRAGIERRYEKSLRGHRGLTVDRLDSRGHTIASTVVRQPLAGSDVVLTIDPALQHTAQKLLDEALARRLPSGSGQLDVAAGGALVAIEVHTGAVLAAASAPRFDPGSFAHNDSELVKHWLNDPARPLFDRSVQMALPPGSVFKIVSATALLSAGIDPEAPFECQGYLHQPDVLRCAIFRRFGIGHGPVTLADALARSCNVYFFHYAEQIGASPLVDWAQRLGMGSTTGIDLPGEVSGNLPHLKAATAAAVDGRSNSDPATAVGAGVAQDPLMICIGQGPITATPLQVVRMVAAIANGGYLVTPHVADHLDQPAAGNFDGNAQSTPESVRKTLDVAAPRRIPGLDSQMLAVIRKGLRQTVADQQGTAHGVINIEQVAIAGKTGTAETGGGQAEHAWFIGYAPADKPKVAFVVVLEHAGNAGPTTGPVIQHLVARMEELGYFGAPQTPVLGEVERQSTLK
jgi:penicillin-binding protein 2